jgi:hypothetical protein
MVLQLFRVAAPAWLHLVGGMTAHYQMCRCRKSCDANASGAEAQKLTCDA